MNKKREISKHIAKQLLNAIASAPMNNKKTFKLLQLYLSGSFDRMIRTCNNYNRAQSKFIQSCKRVSTRVASVDHFTRAQSVRISNLKKNKKTYIRGLGKRVRR